VALVLAALLGRAAVSRGAATQPEPVVTSASGVRLFTRAELARHDGRNSSVIWLALCGQVRAGSRAGCRSGR
jgi:hypothetical protein